MGSKVGKLMKYRRVDACEKCQSKDNLTVEHIIPSSFFRLFSPSWISEAADNKLNLKVLCTDCNGKKGSLVELSNDNVETMKRVIDAAKKEWDNLGNQEGLFNSVTNQ